MKKYILLLSIMALILSGCGAADNKESTPSTIPDSMEDSAPESIEGSASDPSESSEPETPVGSVSPTTDEELYRFVIDSWKSGEYARLYPYADNTLKALLSESDFTYMISSVSEIGGALLSDQTSATTGKNGTVFSSTLDFENITVDLVLSIRDVKISGFNRNVHFKHTFEFQRNGYNERYFVFESNGFRLNAVYTYVSDGQTHPSVLLISGSGPSDYNETVGLLTPFADISEALANQGINSLRIDKRTLNYAGSFEKDHTIDEEYLQDCSAAIDYLKSQPETASVSLLGHSLGGQIAAMLAADRDDIESIILFNSTARPLIDVLFDQLAAADPANKELYQTMVDTVKALNEDTATGRNYLGAGDYYWISVNQINVVDQMKRAGIPALIINSKNDNQIFDEDISLWQSAFSKSDLVTIYIDDSMSHFGYEIDTADQASLYRRTALPERLTELFTEFLLK